jgi:hypothetical protein
MVLDETMNNEVVPPLELALIPLETGYTWDGSRQDEGLPFPFLLFSDEDGEDEEDINEDDSFDDMDDGFDNDFDDDEDDFDDDDEDYDDDEDDYNYDEDVEFDDFDE